MKILACSLVFLLSLAVGVELSSDVSVTWEISDTSITFNFVVSDSAITQYEWVGFGIQPTPSNGMVGADLYSVKINTWAIEDSHREDSDGRPTVDTRQDVTIVHSDDGSSHTISITRDLVLSGTEDVSLEVGEEYGLQYAFGLLSNDVYDYHTSKGSKTVTLSEDGDEDDTGKALLVALLSYFLLFT